MADVQKDSEKKMEGALKALNERFAAIRAGRANPNVLNHIEVEYYGVMTPLQQVANISVPEARVIAIKPYDKSLQKAIIKAIQISDLGINPTSDGTSILLVFPQLTEERRKELVKEVKKESEQAKTVVRNIRREANDALKKAQKASEITEDDQKDGEEKIQKLTDKYIAKIDDAVADKTKELMTV
ncbi:MAG: ribosome recycling factor [Lachnospiraceae bacterium]|jgi:ribosome recycling factor